MSYTKDSDGLQLLLLLQIMAANRRKVLINTLKRLGTILKLSVLKI